MTTRLDPKIEGQILRNMTARWSPYNLEVLMHHYASRAPFPRADAPAYPGCIRELRYNGLMEMGSFAITLRGALFVGMLLQTPVPKENPPG